MSLHQLLRWSLTLGALLASIACVSVNPVSAPVQPSLKISSPADGSSLPQGQVTVTVQVSDFNIVNKEGQPAETDEGHVLFFLDVTAPTAPGHAATTERDTYASVAGTSYTWSSVPPGLHKLSAELVNNDNTPLEPPQVVEITVTIIPDTPTPIPSPTPVASPSP